MLAATGATRSRAYEIAGQVRDLLPTLCRSPGRPPAEHPAPAPSMLAELRGEALRFVMAHPGCVRMRDGRMRYAEPWRRFVLAVVERHDEVPCTTLADALCMPLGTLEDWLRVPPSAAFEPAAPHEPDAEREHDTKLAQIETVLDAWRTWHGDFSAFCEHVRRDLRVELGKTLIANILFAHGARKPARRPGRSRDEHALRGAFETFFPGAQWVADGKRVEVVIDGEVLHVNLELVIDAATDAAVGCDIRDEEDSPALVAAFENGVATTGEPPLALLVDNRPSNHTPEVDVALGDTMRIDATPGRAQNKAHVEGTFGLFAQKIPALQLDTTVPARALARSLVLLVVTTFFRAWNRTPRHDRARRSRVDLYAQDVSAEEREAAREALQQRLHKQQLARQTRAARIDPLVCAQLDAAFTRLSLLDPERRVRDAIAGYPLDAIVDGLAIFEGKQRRNTLPAGIDARYLLGIVRNVHHVHEGDAILQALLRERIEARDRLLSGLLSRRDKIFAQADIDQRLNALTSQLCKTDRELDRHFWIDAIALVAPVPQDERQDFARRCARRIDACFALCSRERHRIVRTLLRRLWPLT
ncbi:MAG TPA: hypothetical protein VFN67_04915 [Polyangiales bacterium]|nr:hypothetical protein [Polyangiales bacterium]